MNSRVEALMQEINEADIHPELPYDMKKAAIFVADTLSSQGVSIGPIVEHKTPILGIKDRYGNPVLDITDTGYAILIQSKNRELGGIEFAAQLERRPFPENSTIKTPPFQGPGYYLWLNGNVIPENQLSEFTTSLNLHPYIHS